MVLIATVAIWHGIQKILGENEKHNFFAFLVLTSVFLMYNVVFIINILIKVFYIILLPTTCVRGSIVINSNAIEMIYTLLRDLFIAAFQETQENE